MAVNYIKKLQTETGLSKDQLIKTLGLDNYDIKFVNKSFAELDAIIQTCVLNELDKFIWLLKPHNFHVGSHVEIDSLADEISEWCNVDVA